MNGLHEKSKDGTKGSCVRWMGTAQLGQKVTIGRTVVDWMENFLLKGVGGEHLRRISLKSATKYALMTRNWRKWLDLNYNWL